eukprot:TRINITY_DN857_c0_g1_i9.p1 TRINITY_DN857_c0_g1~~TRINITY_DN857_c0_g1_i9.p1  ORF type:complete len:222 (+),score=-21.03 TRINITY_DN857_c0_g1_i9:219-884(+)
MRRKLVPLSNQHFYSISIIVVNDGIQGININLLPFIAVSYHFNLYRQNIIHKILASVFELQLLGGLLSFSENLFFRNFWIAFCAILVFSLRLLLQYIVHFYCLFHYQQQCNNTKFSNQQFIKCISQTLMLQDLGISMDQLVPNIHFQYYIYSFSIMNILIQVIFTLDIIVSKLVILTLRYVHRQLDKPNLVMIIIIISNLCISVYSIFCDQLLRRYTMVLS